MDNANTSSSKQPNLKRVFWRHAGNTMFAAGLIATVPLACFSAIILSGLPHMYENSHQAGNMAALGFIFTAGCVGLTISTGITAALGRAISKKAGNETTTSVGPKVSGTLFGLCAAAFLSVGGTIPFGIASLFGIVVAEPLVMAEASPAPALPDADKLVMKLPAPTPA